MERGSWHCTGDREQDHPQEKEKQKSKMAEEALQLAVKKEKWNAKEKRKDMPIWMQSSRRDKKALLSDQCKEVDPDPLRTCKYKHLVLIKCGKCKLSIFLFCRKRYLVSKKLHIWSFFFSTIIINCASILKSSWKIKRVSSKIFQVGEQVEVQGRWGPWRRHGSSMPFPITWPVHLFHLANSGLYPFITGLYPLIIN